VEYDVIARKPPAPPPPSDAPGGTTRKRVPLRRSAVTLAATPGTPRKKAAAAGPVRAGAERRPAPETTRLDALQGVILGSLEDDKAENIVTIELAGRATFADRMVVATGLADRQITAMATHLEEKLEESGLRRVQVEGGPGSDWVLIDAGDIVVHLFKPEARTLYALERMWGAELDEEPPAAD
jgi:ribosome silencing factor RsfS/YbeB/iojap